MAASFPYTFIACPCSSETTSPTVSAQGRRTSRLVQQEDTSYEPEDRPFDPHDSKAAFLLYPYDDLLFCDECQQIRCPRCWTEEITQWHCPSCLFDVPGSLVKSDGNRCTRNCYNCPTCTAPLSINGLDQQPKDHLSPQDASQPSGPFFLMCPYCNWTSLDSGIEFSRPTKITDQLLRLRTGKSRERSSLGRFDISEAVEQPSTLEVAHSTRRPVKDAAFANLASFYKTQLSESDTSDGGSYAENGYGSPSSLTRIMQLYGGLSAAALKKSREKPQPMREALSAAEGLTLTSLDGDSAVIERTRQEGQAVRTTHQQRNSHPWNYDAQFINELWPVPALLRTRRSKRCRTCRHILIRHEDKKGSSRYRIRLLAQAHIPRLTLRPLSSPAGVSSASAFALTPAALKAAKGLDYELRPGKAVQFLLTLTNPLFDPVKISLATPAVTPGRVQSRVTILCPSFDIGADGDVWDEALGSSQAPSSRTRPGTGPLGTPTTAGLAEDRQPEAGKVWEKGRNWTSVVVEVTPGPLVSPAPPTASSAATRAYSAAAAAVTGDSTTWPRSDEHDDDDVLDIPVLVRMEWDAEIAAEDAAGPALPVGAKAPRESRELSFWSVLGAGRIVR